MSLLVTSCTMGKNPDRLLHKGPQYLRTRTNASLFGQHKKSAVELLAASKSQFYSIKESVDLDKHQDLAVSAGQTERYSTHNKVKEPPRSKSQYDLSQLQLSRTEDESDENNNDTSDDSINVTSAEVLEGTEHLSLQDNIPVKKISLSEATPLVTQTLDNGNAIICDYSADVAGPHSGDSNILTAQSPLPSKPQPKLTILRSSAQVHVQEGGNKSSSTPQRPTQLKTEDIVDGGTLKKPVPLPRKLKEKPVPPPRRNSPRTPVAENTRELSLNSRLTASAPYSLRSPTQHNRSTLQETPKLAPEEKPLIKERLAIQRKHSLVESLTQRFTALSAASTPAAIDTAHLSNKGDRTPDKTVTENGNVFTYTATPIFIGKPDTNNQNFQAKPVFKSSESCASPGSTATLTQGAVLIKPPDVPSITAEVLATTKSRKRCPDVPVSNEAVKRERRSITSDISTSEKNVLNCTTSKSVPVEKNHSSSTSKSEMSIESADQAVYESEISAIPSASIGDSMLGEEDEAREVTRTNSSLSGKMEQQDSSPLSLSPTPQCSSSVPRSHSDISCRLEGQHSRDSSIVSNHSRLSRASAGADLENFFNQMGLEKGVLEPISRLRELQTSEVFDSMSSLDSQDAASICSTYSRSEQEWSDTQSVERSQQQTSIVERNARIIKWLCNVRKAKGGPQKTDSTATTSKA